MRTLTARLARALALLLLVGCASAPKAHHGAEWSLARDAARAQGVALAPVVFAADLEAPVLAPAQAPGAIAQLQQDEGPPPTVLDPADPRHAAFLRNDFVGNVRFGGGFVHTGEVALDVRARLIELGQDEVYREQAARWVDTALADALQRRGVATRPVEPFPVPGPERIRYRGEHPQDGRDNVNLPRASVEPAPLSEAAREAARAAGAEDLVLVPMVRSYLSHNGGWFVGQRWGCMSGARAELLLTLYDLDSGEPVWWLATEASFRDGPGTPSAAELDAALLAVEQQTEQILRKRMLR